MAENFDWYGKGLYKDPTTGGLRHSELLGEGRDFEQGMKDARESVLSGIDYAYKPQETSVAGMIKKRGFGTGQAAYAPGVSASAFRPLMDSKANATRTALTDLFFRGEDLYMKKQESFRQNLGLLDSLSNNKAKRDFQEGGGKIICTALLKQGLITEEDRQVTLDFKQSLKAGDEINASYQSWAKHIVPLIHKYKLVAQIWKYIVKSWVKYIKKEPTIAGTVIHYTLYAATVGLSKLQHKKYTMEANCGVI